MDELLRKTCTSSAESISYPVTERLRFAPVFSKQVVRFSLLARVPQLQPYSVESARPCVRVVSQVPELLEEGGVEEAVDISTSVTPHLNPGVRCSKRISLRPLT